MVETLYITNTAGSSTGLPATDTSLLSGNIKATQYKNVRITSSVQITTSGTSALNNISLKIKLGATTLATITYKPLAELRVITVPVEYIGDVSAGGSVSITASASSADATQTTIIARNLYVHSLE